MNFKRIYLSTALWAAIPTLAVSPVSAITINLQYPGSPLFSAALDPTAKAAINAAAADISAAITSSLNTINTDVYTGNNSSTTATFNFLYSYLDPVTGATVNIDTATAAANTVTMFVGAQNIFGSTLGTGGHGGFGYGLSGLGSASNWVGAVAIAQSNANAAYKRGGGPVISSISGQSTLGGATANFTFEYGVAYGQLSLDWDGNNNGIKDSDAELNNYWHFDHTTAVAGTKRDLYSVALHEMLHALGIGASDSWDAKHSGTTWTGSNVLALTGSGVGLTNPAADHIAEGTLSYRISDGTDQEVAMDPSILIGSRKSLTALDLAFLRDIGYSTIIPSPPTFDPGDFEEDGDVDGMDLVIWQNNFRLNAAGDADNDLDTDGRDFLIWQRNYTGPLLTATSVAVPEPSAIMLLVGSVLAGLGMRG